ncbi:DUF2812 domain-containing protein [Paenibacillus kobensis]|uniref:DUF2812 domain-containing protein n=1 Tax=Paenibacillus kobensis TaxID=59841 RepID=UPI000FD820FF|nr:DUF2812 domain-containing protein [Paenibacillus kobensis]
MMQKAGGKMEYRTRVSFVWNYEKDEQWMTDLSAQGLHLVKPGIVRSRFEKDTDRRYVYKVDYHQLKKGEELKSYLALFEDMGWEHVSSYMGWHYFRKPYAEGESYEIYTDRTTIIQLWKRVQTTFLMILLANIPILILNLVNMFETADRSEVISSTIASVSGFQTTVALLLLYGWFRFQNKIKQLSTDSPQG